MLFEYKEIFLTLPLGLAFLKKNQTKQNTNLNGHGRFLALSN